MSIIEYEDEIVEIVNREDHSNFLYELLDVYDIPRATITRLKSGNQNIAKKPGEIHLKNRVWFKEANEDDLFNTIVKLEEQVEELSAKPRYLIVTDFDELLAKDTKTKEPLDIKFKELPQHFAFFLAWKGIEKVGFEKENPADIKAAERFARIYDVVKKENNLIANNNRVDLFFMRLLFCMFSEDTDIFKRGSFTNSIKSLTQTDGTDLNNFFENFFEVLDKEERDEVPTYFKEFPYVNGQLFTDPHIKLTFSAKARKLIIECGELLNWAKINPDIFGSMIQAVATDVSRSQLGMHYTSVPNIMKVIKPLFLDDLNKNFEQAYHSVEKLDSLYDRIGKIKFFDPACGSGNFLIITYKELRRLEIKILLRKRELTENLMYLPSVTLDQFYGIELDEFAHDVARLSLWITEHQMNMELEEAFGDKVRATLPLQSAGEIRCANALRTNWDEVCSNNGGEEIFVFGNPPYLGHSLQLNTHKKDIRAIFEGVKGNGYLDYICGWFLKGSEYIKNTNSSLAFVSTNSISQGNQVAILWNEILSKDIVIHFAYQSFKWNNNAKNNAGVTVVIIGLSNNNQEKRHLFTNYGKKNVNNINPYLVDGDNVLIKNTKKQLSGLPPMLFGNKPSDGGGLIFNITEYRNIVNEYPFLKKYFRKYIGSKEFLEGTHRYCLWLNELEYMKIKDNPIILERINKVIETRKNSKAESTQLWANKPYMFKQIAPFHKMRTENLDSYTIVVPAVSSENRFYIPIGLVNNRETILSNRVYGIFDADIWVLGLLQSRMHMSWVKAVGARFEMRYSYSSGVCYNAFPIPKLSQRRINQIEELVLNIIDIREEDGRSLDEIYKVEKMPEILLEAHKKLDKVVDRAYRSDRDFMNDDERLEVLIELYKSMTI